MTIYSRYFFWRVFDRKTVVYDVMNEWWEGWKVLLTITIKV